MSRIAEIFLAFLKLGLTSFGGPIAHLGYFREAFVLRRTWLDEAGFADLVALCQFLPGPASSQVGFSLGVLRGGGVAGGLAAWAGFTLPSAFLLLAAALGAATLDGPLAHGILHGLKLVAVVVVAQAVFGMARTLTPDRPRAAIALAAIALALLPGGPAGQVAAIVVGALAGLWLCRGAAAPITGHLAFPVRRPAAVVALLLFALLLLLMPLLAAWYQVPLSAAGHQVPLPAAGHQGVALFAAFYRAGALVFGGGHVVLPLLQAETVAPGWVSPDSFLAGYGLTQAVPGPLFTFSAYLGAVSGPAPHGLAGAAIALVGIFLPGLLLVYGTLPFWDALRRRPQAQAAMRGANAAVVGILAMALYNPVWTSAVLSPRDFAFAAAGFTLLMLWKLPPWVIVLLLGAAGGLSAL
jgi:chromate transporter